MQIILEIEDLETLVDGLNNAVIAYGNVASALILGVSVPSNLEPLRTLPEEVVRSRFTAVVDLYKTLESKL